MTGGQGPGALGVGLTADALNAIDSDALIRFFVKQRWFAAKGGAPSNARVTTVVPLPWGDGVFAMTRVSVDVDGKAHDYQVPVAARVVAADTLPERAVIGGVDVHGTTVTLYDAVEDPEFRRGLADAIGAGVSAHNDEGDRWLAEAKSAKRLVVPPQAEIRVGSAEQSNTSIIFDAEAILKLFRKLESGIHPDAEVTEFLTTRAGFAHVPVLLGTMAFERAGERTVAGMLQEYLPKSRDAWSYALERSRPYFIAPKDREPKDDFVPDAHRLGVVTRELHEALASDDDDPAFAPAPATPDDLDRWSHRVQQSIRDALALLERQIGNTTIPHERVAEAQIVVQRRDRYLRWVNELADELGDDLGLLTRIHGDYHLGQVLRSASDDFMVIDFEGEPARPLSERREKASPLRDVAGMLRSFAYAAATLSMEVEKSTDAGTRELRAGRWERDARAAFLAGYLDEGEREDDAAILPGNPDHVRQLIALFETEKVFYELAYELNNRPTWVGIPMRGISKLLVR